jgi:prolyl 4-hydroxylase
MAKLKPKSQEQRLADAGRNVARRLSAPGKTQQVTENNFTLYFVQDFLSRVECVELMKLIDLNRAPSELMASHPDPEFRTSDTCNLHPFDNLVVSIEDRICKLMGVDPRYGETLQGQVYEVGKQFKAHYDWFLKGSSYWDDMQISGGQRTWTAMIYLNEPGAGGETNFPTAGMMVQPRTAMLVIWNNMDELGKPNQLALHAGMPVLAGTKYIVTKWFREKFWT